MQYKYVAAAVLAALPLLAQAQSSDTSVTLYGIIDMALAQEDADAPGVNKRTAVHAGRDSNRFGLRGSEDLGNGLKAIFNVEGGFDGSTGKGDADLYGRRAVVGLEGSFGQLTVGREYTPLDLISGASTTMGQGFYGSNLNAFAQGGMTRRVSNSVNYKTPSMGGLRVMATAAPSEASGKRYAGLGADYTAGALMVGLATASIRRVNGEDKEYILGASYNLGDITLKGNYMVGNPVGAGNTFEQLNFGASKTFGPSAIYANVQQSRFSNGAKGNGLSLAYAYSFSKRTFVYASWATVANNELATFSVASAGSAVTPPLTAPGADPKAFAIGVRHAF